MLCPELTDISPCLSGANAQVLPDYLPEPTEYLAEALGPWQIRLSWNRPNTIGPDNIVRYTYICGSKKRDTQNTPPPRLYVEVIDLEPDTEYNCTVQAIYKSPQPKGSMVRRLVRTPKAG